MASDAPADEDDDSCSICLTPWSSEGAHRVAALRCGHLFGLSCARTAVTATRRCPLCNEPASPDDAVALFVTRVTAADGGAAAESDRVAAAEAAARSRAEAALAKARAEVGRLRARVTALTKANARLVAVLDGARGGGEGGGGGRALPPAEDDAPVDARGRPLVRRRVDEASGASARPVARPRPADDDAPAAHRSLTLSLRASVTLDGVTALAADAAAGVAIVCGATRGGATALRRVSLLSPSLSPATRLPLSSVRDVALAPDAGALLSMAVGRGEAGGAAAAVVDARCGTVAATLAAPFPALCGAWAGPHAIALGLTNGGLALFDVRRPGAAAQAVASPEASAPPRPIHTLRPFAPSSHLLLAATAAGARLWGPEAGWSGSVAASGAPCFAAAAAGGRRALLATRAAPAAPPALALAVWPDDGDDGSAPTTTVSPHPAPFPSSARSVAVVERGEDDAAAAVAAGRTIALWRLEGATLAPDPPVMLPPMATDVVAVAGGGGGVLVAAAAGEVRVARWE